MTIFDYNCLYPVDYDDTNFFFTLPGREGGEGGGFLAHGLP